MSADDRNPRKAPRRFWTRRKIVLACVLVPLVALPLVWLGMVHSAQKALDREIALIRARGEPVTWEEMAPPPVPDDENAVELLDAVFVEIDDVESQDAHPRDILFRACDLREGGPASERKKVVADLAPYAKALSLAREALTLPRYGFERDFPSPEEEAESAEYRAYEGLTHLACLFGARAVLDAQAGRTEEAIVALESIARIARFAESVQFWAEGYVHFRFFDSLWIVTSGPGLPVTHTRRLLAVLDTIDTRGALTRATLQIRIGLHEAFTRLAQGKSAALMALPRQSVLWKFRWPPKASLRLQCIRDTATVLRLSTEIVDASRLPPGEDFAQMQKLCRALWKVYSRYCTGYVTEYHFVFVSHFVSIAQRDATIIGLACELFRSKHGTYPETLEALVPDFLAELPPDPFTGKPFVYRREPGGGFVVYSVGDNLTDDGGARDPAADHDDVAWEGKAPSPGSSSP